MAVMRVLPSCLWWHQIQLRDAHGEFITGFLKTQTQNKKK